MIRIKVKDEDGVERYLVTTKPLKLTTLKERATTWADHDEHLQRCLAVLARMGVEATVDSGVPVNGHRCG